MATKKAQAKPEATETKAPALVPGQFISFSAEKKVRAKIGSASRSTISLGKVAVNLPLFSSEAYTLKGLDAEGLPEYSDEELNLAYQRFISSLISQQVALYPISGDNEVIYKDVESAKASLSVATTPAKPLPDTWETLLSTGQSNYSAVSTAYTALVKAIGEAWSEDESIGAAKAGIMISPWLGGAMVSVPAIAEQIRTLAGTPLVNQDIARKAANRAKIMAAMGAAIEDIELDETDPEYDTQQRGLSLLQRVYAAAQAAIEAETESGDDADMEL